MRNDVIRGTSSNSRLSKPKKSAALYADELFKRGLKLNIQPRNGAGWKDINRAQSLSNKFSMELLRIYDGAQNVKTPTPDGARWKLLEEKLGTSYKYAKDIAAALSMRETDVNTSELLREECRAKRKSVFRAIVGLGLWQDEGGEGALSERFARSGEVTWTPKKEGKANGQKTGTPDQADAGKGDEQNLSQIREIGWAFGYHLPEKADDEKRMELFDQIDAKIKQRHWDTNKTLDLNTDVIDTLKNLKNKWSENPNRLHVIIAAEPQNAASIKAAYHALSLHPVGIENLPTDDHDAIRRVLVITADRVVVTASRYIYPLSECVKPEYPGENAEVFWSLMCEALDYWDCITYKKAKLKLCDQLFYSTKKAESKEQKQKTLEERFETGRNGSAFDPEQAFDPEKILEQNKQKEKKEWWQMI